MRSNEAPAGDQGAGEGARAPRSHFRLVVLLGALAAFSPLAIDMYLPGFPEIAIDLRAPAGKVPLTLSMFLVGLAGGQLAWGPASDRAGRRLPLLIGCVGFTVAALLCAASRTIEELVAARFLMGLAGASGLVIARAIVRDLFDESGSARVFSMMMLVTGIAPLVAPSLGGQVLALAGWRAIFGVLAGCGALSGLAVLVDFRESLPGDRRSRGPIAELPARYGELLVDRRFLAPALSVGFAAGLLFAYITAAPLVFMQLYGISPRWFGVFFSGNAIGMFGAAQFNRRLLRSTDSQTILRVASALNAGAGLLLAVVGLTGIGGFPLFYAMLFACMASLGLIFPNATAASLAPFAHQAGVASALLGMIQYAVGAGAGSMVGLLYDGTVRAMVGVVACCGIAGFLVARRSGGRRHPPQSDRPQDPA